MFKGPEFETRAERKEFGRGESLRFYVCFVDVSSKGYLNNSNGIAMTTNKQGSQTPEYAASFRHWRSGKVYYAKDYGYKAWPFGNRS